MTVEQSANQDTSDSEIRGLIRDAFSAARHKGKPDWDRMTLAVLKNRLLDLTNKSFSESDFGALDLKQFVRQFPDLLELNDNVRHAEVQYLSGDSQDNGDGPPTKITVRTDLWKAILDFSSGHRYVWDLEAKEARLNTLEDDSAYMLPIVTAEQMQEWRTGFADNNASGEKDEKLLSDWAIKHFPASSLPGLLRREWSNLLKDHVVEITSAWFAEKNIELPVDLVQSVPTPIRMSRATSELNALRQLVISCVSSMTRDELSELRLPPTALLRSKTMSDQRS